MPVRSRVRDSGSAKSVRSERVISLDAARGPTGPRRHTTPVGAGVACADGRADAHEVRYSQVVREDRRVPDQESARIVRRIVEAFPSVIVKCNTHKIVSGISSREIERPAEI
ncbi:hypothetical protein RE0356_31430 [Prescottella equi]|nr:hypothetical protein RE0356_31430 [Prescottella equi]